MSYSRRKYYCYHQNVKSIITIVGRAIILEGEPSKKKQRTDTKKDVKRIKSDNFTRSNREKSNIAISILEKLIFG